jgi:hypothetical protein
MGCAPPAPVGADDVTRYTGLTLCPGSLITDRTTAEERDTVPGFSFHVVLKLDQSCEAKLIDQLARLSPRGCPPAWTRQRGCYIEDASVVGLTKKRTSIMITPAGAGRYDLRFYQ